MSYEIECLITAVRRFLYPAVALPDVSSIDWLSLIRLAVDHVVVPMLYDATSNIAIPEATRRELRVRYESSVKYSLAQSAALVRAAELLEQHKIPFVALKS